LPTIFCGEGKLPPAHSDDETRSLVDFTKKLWGDKDFVPALLPVRDGVGIAIRVSKKG